MKSKYKIVILLFFIFAINKSLAQTHYSSNVSIGAKAGIEMPYVFFNPSVKQSLPVGAACGIMFRYVEESHFGLIAEANFVQRGWKENFEDADFKYRRTINYIEIPVLAHIYFGRRGKFFINAGPEVSFVVNESTSSNFDYIDLSNVKDFPIKYRTTYQYDLPAQNKVDFGICAGIGGEFNINKKNAINLEARFYYGIGNLMKAGRRDPFRASNAMAVSVTCGYWFRIK